jgi:hypothetical protein
MGGVDLEQPGVLQAPCGQQLPNGLGRLPDLGWVESWSAHAGNPHERLQVGAVDRHPRLQDLTEVAELNGQICAHGFLV